MYIKKVWILLILCYLHKDFLCTTDNRIIGGRPANEGEIPYQVSIRRSYNDEHFCGGTLITPKHVLVAAHCMYYAWGGVLPPIVVSVVAGQLMLPIAEQSVYRNASLITIHESFNKTTMANDIAIIEVNEDFPTDTNPIINTISLRNTSLDAGNCFVSGWGVEEYDSEIVSQILLIAEVNIVKFGQCQLMYSPNITLSQGMLCAGHENGTTDACKGDSGGPLVCDGLLTGIVSTGSGCGSADYPGIYTDVAYFHPWIESVINTESSLFPYQEKSHDNFTTSNGFLTSKTLERNSAINIKFNFYSLTFLLSTLVYHKHL